MKKICTLGEEWHFLSGTELFHYKAENAQAKRATSTVIVLKAAAVRKLLDYLKLSTKIPMIEEKKAEVEVARTPEPRMVNTDECIVALNVLRYLKYARENWQEEYG